MTATRAIVAPLIDASLNPPTAAHTPRTQKRARSRFREIWGKRRMVRNGRDSDEEVGGLGKERGKRGGEQDEFWVQTEGERLAEVSYCSAAI
ncbi:hypothetical protein ABG768_027820 [Culter alburnus]|uniref:Uncharacterized protein n=1 Tax=Culter alburnus TaxID=194366 RepID=A0AAW2A9D3_CULAL